MSIKAKYYAVFGLNENASKDDLRKAYRKLAMKYHPDKNSDPKAHQLFVDLAEAYEILINDKIPGASDEGKTRKEKTFDERRKEAEFRYKQQQQRERKEEEKYFKNLTNGLKWKIFRRMAQFSALLSFLMIIDSFLPKHIENHLITGFSPQYNGILNGQVICFKTDKDLSLFVKNSSASMYNSHPKIIVERSWIFHNPTRVWHDISFKHRSYEVDFSVLSIFPAVPFLFLVPIFTLLYKRKSYIFTFLYLFSFYLIGISVVYFILSQDRWVHLLTLGFL